MERRSRVMVRERRGGIRLNPRALSPFLPPPKHRMRIVAIILVAAALVVLDFLGALPAPFSAKGGLRGSLLGGHPRDKDGTGEVLQGFAVRDTSDHLSAARPDGDQGISTQSASLMEASPLMEADEGPMKDGPDAPAEGEATLAETAESTHPDTLAVHEEGPTFSEGGETAESTQTATLAVHEEGPTVSEGGETAESTQPDTLAVHEEGSAFYTGSEGMSSFFLYEKPGLAWSPGGVFFRGASWRPLIGRWLSGCHAQAASVHVQEVKYTLGESFLCSGCFRSQKNQNNRFLGSSKDGVEGPIWECKLGMHIGCAHRLCTFAALQQLQSL